MPYDDTKRGDAEDQAKIEVVDGSAFPEGSMDEFTYRLAIVELAENYIFDVHNEGTEYADKRLPCFVRTIGSHHLKVVSEEDVQKAVLNHVAYLRAQKQTIKALNGFVLGVA